MGASRDRGTLSDNPGRAVHSGAVHSGAGHSPPEQEQPELRAEPLRAKSLWRHRDFLLPWSGQTVSEMGSAVTQPAGGCSSLRSAGWAP
jgi:hypothetical protein